MKRRLWTGGMPLSSKCLTASMWIVGTAEYHVGRGSAASASTIPTALKEAKHEICAPAARLARIDPESPPMWNSGMTLRHMSSGVSWKLLPSSSALRTSWPWRRGTPLGMDVVPDVLRSRQTSSADRESCTSSARGLAVCTEIRFRPPRAMSSSWSSSTAVRSPAEASPSKKITC
eukprot:scaffold78403_cov30-Tisochrysis_lutea.AAC.4